MNNNDKSFIALLLRSSDEGEGYRKVSLTLWPLVEKFQAKELIEINYEKRMVKLSEKGEIVAKYL